MPAFTVRISRELLPIWRGPLIVSVWPGWRMWASAVASVCRGRYHGSSTSSVPPGSGNGPAGSGAAYSGGRWTAGATGALAGPVSNGAPPPIASSNSRSRRGVSAGPAQRVYWIGIEDTR